MSLADMANLVEPIHHYGDQFRSILVPRRVNSFSEKNYRRQGWRNCSRQSRTCSDRGESVHRILLLDRVTYKNETCNFFAPTIKKLRKSRLKHMYFLKYNITHERERRGGGERERPLQLYCKSDLFFIEIATLGNELSGVKKTSHASVHATTRNDSLAYLLMCEFTCGARDSPAGTHVYIHSPLVYVCTHSRTEEPLHVSREDVRIFRLGVRRAYKRSFAGAVYDGLGSMSHTCRPVLPARHVTTFLRTIQPSCAHECTSALRGWREIARRRVAT